MSEMTAVPFSLRIHRAPGVTMLALAQQAEKALLQEEAALVEAVREAEGELASTRIGLDEARKALVGIQSWLQLNAR